MSGLVRQALRANPWAFAGPASTQCVAAAIVTAALSANRSLAGRVPGDVADVGVIFVTTSIYLTTLIVGVTMAAAVGRQMRDIALVRAVGATPRRVRRAVALQAAIVAGPATAAGVPLGLLLGALWLDGLSGHGIVGPAVTFRPAWYAPLVALAVTGGTSLAGARIAAIRASRIRPAVALTEAAVPRRRTGWLRLTLGLLLVAGGAVLSVVISRFGAAQADQAGLFVMLAMCVGAGLLAPALLRAAAPLARLSGRAGAVAADNLAAHARAYSPALIPLTLSIAFAAVTMARITTETHVTGVRPDAADLWLTVSGTTVYAAFAAVAALNTLITVVMSRRRDLAVMRLAGATRGRALAVVVCEALTVTTTGLVIAAVVAGTTLLPLLHTALGTWVPWMPPSYWGAGIAGAGVLVLTGTVLPAALATRVRPIEAAG